MNAAMMRSVVTGCGYAYKHTHSICTHVQISIDGDATSAMVRGSSTGVRVSGGALSAEWARGDVYDAEWSSCNTRGCGSCWYSDTNNEGRSWQSESHCRRMLTDGDVE